MRHEAQQAAPQGVPTDDTLVNTEGATVLGDLKIGDKIADDFAGTTAFTGETFHGIVVSYSKAHNTVKVYFQQDDTNVFYKPDDAMHKRDVAQT
jgi:hypothetical protein